MTRVIGIDVSHWQGTMNWPVAYAAGVRFAFIKATDGAAWFDQQFANNWPAAKAAGILRGAYHYYRPAQPARPQAQNLFARLEGDLGELPPVLDVEQRPLSGPAIRECADEIARLFGQRPLIYTSTGVWNELGSQPWAAAYPLWLAQYPRPWTPDLIDLLQAWQPTLPTPWQTWEFWQFTSSAHGPAFGAASATVDLDFFHGDEAALLAWANVSPPEPPPPVEPPPAPDPLAFAIARLEDVREAVEDALYQLSLGPPPAPLGRLARVVASGGVNIRNAPSITARVVGSLPYFATITVLIEHPDGPDLWVQHAAGWSAMRYNNKQYLAWLA